MLKGLYIWRPLPLGWKTEMFPGTVYASTQSSLPQGRSQQGSQGGNAIPPDFVELEKRTQAEINNLLLFSDPPDFWIFLWHCDFKWNSKSVQFGLSVLNNSAWNLIKKTD